MDVTVTVVSAAGGRTDVQVSVPAAAPAGELRLALVEAGLADPASPSLYVDGRRLDDREVTADRLVEGAVVRDRPEVRERRGVVELRVAGGPRCGTVHPLPQGVTLVGRGPGSGLRLDDDAAVSREHLRVDVVGQEVTVTDLGSTNGTLLEGQPLTAPSRWCPGERLSVGGSTLLLALTPALPPDAPAPPEAAGRVLLALPPRLRVPDPAPDVVFPKPPQPRREHRFPVAAALAPLLVGVVAAGVLRSPTFLLFALLSPAVVLAGAVAERGQTRRDHRAARREFTARARAATAALAAAVSGETRRRHEDDPDPATLLAAARDRSAPLWERRSGDSDVLRMRLGTGDMPARLRAVDGPAPVCPGVPVTAELGEVAALGLVGERAEVLALARTLVGSAAVLHPPGVLRLCVLAPGRLGDWDWARWLPHSAGSTTDGTIRLHGDTHAARRALRELVAEGGRPTAGARTLVVVDGEELRDDPGLGDLLERGRDLGVSVLHLATDRRTLPSTCPAVLEDTGTEDGWTLRRDGQPDVTGVVADRTPPQWAERIARHLAPLVPRGAGDASPLPAEVPWRTLVGLHLTGSDDDSARVLEHWSRTCGPTAVIGRAADGPLVVDLRRDGPHCLVAGTTGSGKSEFLQTLVAGLALGNPPDALRLLLVDYKGGAAFGSCADLPHTAGVMTDLDPVLTRRALASLHAELRRRERVLLEAGVADLDAYETRCAAEAPGAHQPLPRLVVVVDEFASLAEELPEFVRGLVAVAQRGRSLGVHLVLATQRPEGSVSQDIRANTALRVCLAVAREAESRDVLGVPDAAHLGRRTPGRAYLKRGAEPLLLLQAGRVAVPHGDTVLRADVTRVRAVPVQERASGRGPGSPPPPRTGPTDLDLLVAACARAAETRGLPVPASPWLPPLPERVTLDDLDDLPGGPGIPFALQDVPAEQRRRALRLDLREHLLVVGGPRSGRTGTLLTIAGAAARAETPDRLHLVGLGNTRLHGLDALPHCGAVVTMDESERVPRLVAALTAEVRARRMDPPPAHPTGRPHLLLLLDQWDAFVAAYADVDAGRVVEDLVRVLREGPALGVTAVVTGDRSALVGRVAGVLTRRLLLRMPEAGDYAAVGVPPREVPAGLPPGRGFCSEGLATQVALLDPGPLASPRETLTRLAAAAPAATPGTPPPLRVDALPGRCTRADTEALRTSPVAGRVVTPGLGGDRLGPLDVDLDEAGPLFLVAGPPRSGRSTALVTLAASLLTDTSRSPGASQPLPVVVVAPRPSPVRDLVTLSRGQVTVVTDGRDGQTLERLLAQPCLLVVDDAELLADTALAPALDAAVASARDTATVVLAAGTTHALLGAYRGWVTDARRGRTGLLLAPESPADGELLGCRLPRVTPTGVPLPGRGLLVVRGVAEPVQVALPEPPPLGPASTQGPVRAEPPAAGAPGRVRTAA